MTIIATEIAPSSTTTCVRCEPNEHEVYLYFGNQFEFDVELARQIVSDGREPVEVDDDSVQTALRRSIIHEEHIDHVDPSFPGIISFVHMETDEGETVTAHLLIDGHHRAARCVRDHLPFQAYLLSEEESRSIVVRSPNKPGHSFMDTPEPEQLLLGETIADLDEKTTRDYTEKFASSLSWSLRARAAFAGATTHDRRGFGPFGVYIDHAEGPYKWDLAGNRLIDFWMGHGSLLCGHGFKPVVDAVMRQIQRGTHYGACHPLEVRWAELIQAMIPSAQRVRFTGSGTEATLLACRIARAYTGRRVILKFEGHFHGWHDEAMAHGYLTDRAGFNPGTVDNVEVFSVVDLDAVVRRISEGDVAGVLLEPGGGGSGGLFWSKKYLQTLRDATRDHGTMLIFDEVITGFRHTPGGVQQAVGVTPDITTLAKILCGGLPGGAVVGSAEVMAVFGDGIDRNGRSAQIPHTGTFNANPLSAAAGIAMLESIRDGQAQEKATRATLRFIQGVNALSDDHEVDVHFYANRTSIYHILIGAHAARVSLGPSYSIIDLHKARPRHYALLRRALLVEGLDTHPLHGWVSADHDSDEVHEACMNAFDRAFRRIRDVEGFRI